MDDIYVEKLERAVRDKRNKKKERKIYIHQHHHQHIQRDKTNVERRTKKNTPLGCCFVSFFSALKIEQVPKTNERDKEHIDKVNGILFCV